ncbi:MAG: hypothetical protein V4709_00165 [Pseudomonadota bacterium]
MNRVLGLFFVLAYLVLCFATLAYWLPNFFVANFQHAPELSYRYVAATGLPFGVLLVTVIARQSFKQFFSIIMFFQVFAAGALLYAALYAFYFPKQANFFCAMHLLMCFSGIVWNIHQHRKELSRFERAAAAAAA